MTQKLTKILAIRHINGTHEVINMMADVQNNTPVNDYDQLLKDIATVWWDGRMDNASVNIIEYLCYTEALKQYKSMGSPDGVGIIINFYESDPDQMNTHSCRGSMVAPLDLIQSMTDHHIAHLNTTYY